MSRTDRRVLLDLLPLGVLLVLLIAVPGASDVITANPPDVAGMPLGIIPVGAALILMLAGLEILRRASSEHSALLAFIGLTLPSAIVMVVAAMLVVVVQNMLAY
ncbi:MAG TPA: hypothetical protein VFP66_00530 [Candidatus Limnocylindrales bacterium]|nr:hypothetical protein [Candidatus Limnocylindrales bacterium]